MYHCIFTDFLIGLQFLLECNFGLICMFFCVLRREAEKERGIDGTDEEEEERSGKRVFGPRKRFRWNEEIRSGLSSVCAMHYY